MYCMNDPICSFLPTIFHEMKKNNETSNKFLNVCFWDNVFEFCHTSHTKHINFMELFLVKIRNLFLWYLLRDHIIARCTMSIFYDASVKQTLEVEVCKKEKN